MSFPRCAIVLALVLFGVASTRVDAEAQPWHLAAEVGTGVEASGAAPLAGVTVGLHLASRFDVAAEVLHFFGEAAHVTSVLGDLEVGFLEGRPVRPLITGGLGAWRADYRGPFADSPNRSGIAWSLGGGVLGRMSSRWHLVAHLTALSLSDTQMTRATVGVRWLAR